MIPTLNNPGGAAEPRPIERAADAVAHRQQR